VTACTTWNWERKREGGEPGEGGDKVICANSKESDGITIICMRNLEAFIITKKTTKTILINSRLLISRERRDTRKRKPTRELD